MLEITTRWPVLSDLGNLTLTNPVKFGTIPCGSLSITVMLGHHFWLLSHLNKTWPEVLFGDTKKTEPIPPSGFMMTCGTPQVESDEWRAFSHEHLHKQLYLFHRFRGPSLIGSQMLSWGSLEEDLQHLQLYAWRICVDLTFARVSQTGFAVQLLGRSKSSLLSMSLNSVRRWSCLTWQTWGSFVFFAGKTR